jgi:PIN domain nuclease of toxin-antitoxin system
MADGLLDASAILALILEEPGPERVEPRLPLVPLPPSGLPALTADRGWLGVADAVGVPIDLIR